MNWRIVVIATALVGSVGLTVGGAFVPETWGEYLPSTMLQFGSALLLVPAVLWIERQLAKQTKEIEASMSADLRASKGIAKLSPAALWDDIYPAFHKFQLITISAAIRVAMPHGSLWLEFSTFAQQQLGETSSMIGLHYVDPATGDGRRHADTYAYWRSGQSLESALNNVRAALRQDGQATKASYVDDDAVVRQLREQLGYAIE